MTPCNSTKLFWSLSVGSLAVLMEWLENGSAINRLEKNEFLE